MLTLKKVKEMVKAPVHTKRVPSPKVLLEDGRILLRKEFEHDSHLTLYHSGYVWFSAGKRNTVFHIHDCCGDYAYDAAEGKGDVIKEEYFENCEWHIRALFEGERKMEDNQAKCEGAGRSNVCVSYHALSEDWSEIADRTINMLEKIIENEAVHAMLAVLTDKQRDLIHQQFVLGKTHQEIADDMGISRTRSPGGGLSGGRAGTEPCRFGDSGGDGHLHAHVKGKTPPPGIQPCRAVGKGGGSPAGLRL